MFGSVFGRVATVTTTVPVGSDTSSAPVFGGGKSDGFDFAALAKQKDDSDMVFGQKKSGEERF